MTSRARPARRGGYGWSERAGRYVDARGRFVGRAVVRDTLDAALDAAAGEMRALAETLRGGPLTADRIAAWEAAMRERVRDVHLYAAAAAKGGWNRMTPADYGRVGQLLGRGPAGGKGQYQYLRQFAADLASGKQRLDGTLGLRAGFYARAARPTYHVFDGPMMATRGFDFESNVRHARDSCAGCVEASARGWVSIGTLPPVGSRDCKQNDRCGIAYYNSSTGDTSGDETIPAPADRAAGRAA